MNKSIKTIFSFLVFFSAFLLDQNLLFAQKNIGIEFGTNYTSASGSYSEKIVLNGSDINAKKRFVEPGYNLALTNRIDLNSEIMLDIKLGLSLYLYYAEPDVNYIATQRSENIGWYSEFSLGYKLWKFNSLTIIPEIGYTPLYCISKNNRFTDGSLQYGGYSHQGFDHLLKLGVLFDYQTSLGSITIQTDYKQKLNKNELTYNGEPTNLSYSVFSVSVGYWFDFETF